MINKLVDIDLSYSAFKIVSPDNLTLYFKTEEEIKRLTRENIVDMCGGDFIYTKDDYGIYDVYFQYGYGNWKSQWKYLYSGGPYEVYARGYKGKILIAEPPKDTIIINDVEYCIGDV
jgi:hypothetical protein